MSKGRNCLGELRGPDPIILPSLLLCDFANLQREAERLEEAGFKALHLDVMDGVFVPNISYGMTIVSALRKVTSLPLDVHLMIANPGQYIHAFRDAGADVITFHAEATTEHAEVLTQIRDSGAGAGLVLNPETQVNEIEGVLPLCDLVLVMSVQAGFGGQAFRPDVLAKFSDLRQSTAANPDLILEIDGGINDQTIGQSSQAGAQWMVVGSGIFKHADYRVAHDQLLKVATS